MKVLFYEGNLLISVSQVFQQKNVLFIEILHFYSMLRIEVCDADVNINGPAFLLRVSSKHI